jgi:TetR/AcrR family fatty acid metabolism transcriptional regulator
VPKIVDGASQRAEIRLAARRAFAARGIAGTGLAHVAAEAGMGRSTLYHYYPGKRALVGDLLRDLLREEEALFAAALAGEGTPRERIERLAGILPTTFADWAQLGTMIFDLWSRNAERYRPWFRRMRTDLADLIRQGQASGEIDSALDPELTAAVVIGAIDGLLLQYLIDPDAFPSFDAMADALTRVVRKALEP